MYRTIVADPPWRIPLGGSWTAREDKARPQRFYATMSVAEIASLTIPCAEQCHLYLWAVAQRVDFAYEVARAWGFEPVILLTWRKSGLGVGRFRCNTEHVLLARKGSRHGQPFGAGGRTAQATGGTCFEWPRGRHSEKPDEFFELVKRLSAGPYLEMFARRPRVGWDVWGHEVQSTVEIA